LFTETVTGDFLVRTISTSVPHLPIGIVDTVSQKAVKNSLNLRLYEAKCTITFSKVISVFFWYRKYQSSKARAQLTGSEVEQE
jgi:hypothetical protein